MSISVPNLNEAAITAAMSPWMVVPYVGNDCLFGYSTIHTSLGGLSWVMSTPIVEFSETSDRARTASGRVYALGVRITESELDEEGTVALRLLSARSDPSYHGKEDDVAWVIACKMARHLSLDPPVRNAQLVNEFIETFREPYMQLYAYSSLLQQSVNRA